MENTSFAYLEAKGKSKVWNAYADYCSGEYIMEEGFNPNSGYVYIALESGIQIACLLGQEVEYFGYDHRKDEEVSFYSYDELIYHLSTAWEIEN
jgi:hypothetical protein